MVNLGSTMTELVLTVMPGTPAENRVSLWDEILVTYGDLNIPKKKKLQIHAYVRVHQGL